MRFHPKHVWHWYLRYERPISSISLVGGFIFDALTLKRVDLFWDNVWVLAHFFIIGACIVVINIQENRRAKVVAKETNVEKREDATAHFWLITILQFFFGGLLSTFLVFYFRSGTIGVSWPFLLLLAIAFIANESFKKHYSRLVFQISLFYLSLFSFAIFIVPVILHQIGPGTFVLSGVLSLVALGLFLTILRFSATETFKKNRKILFTSIVAIFVVTNILYFFDLIPPLPLTLVDGGVYHSLTHTSAGYVVTAEDQGWLGFFNFSQVFHEMPGQPVYAHTSIYSPASLNLTVIHEWQYYDATTSRWVTYSRIPLSIIGGRDGGYNTYSMQSSVAPGKWRVNIKTTSGQIIDRLNFTVIGATTTPPLITRLLN